MYELTYTFKIYSSKNEVSAALKALERLRLYLMAFLRKTVNFFCNL